MQFATYLAAERGRTARVAKLVGLAPAFVSQIANGTRPAPAEHCPAIERACNYIVRRWDLRPDDWHRIWPELIDAEGAPAVPATESATQEVA